jgi:hypothetical protein
VKASDVFLAAAAYQGWPRPRPTPDPSRHHRGGRADLRHDQVAIGLGNLLWMGIGDTIRVSLSADPVEEVKVGYEILKALGLRHRGVNIISCPSCARQGFDVIKTVEVLEKRLEHIKTPMSLSIIGCVVNGPGEALMTDIGFTGGGAGSGMVYLAGKQSHKMDNDRMIEHIVEQVEKKAAEIEAETLGRAAVLHLAPGRVVERHRTPRREAAPANPQAGRRAQGHPLAAIGAVAIRVAETVLRRRSVAVIIESGRAAGEAEREKGRESGASHARILAQVHASRERHGVGSPQS